MGSFPYIATLLVQIYEEMKYLILFLTFAKIGMFTIGGGYAMIPLIEREIVNKKWMTKNDFMEMFALTQSLPGVFAVNISIFVGYKLHKVKGSLVCALATILPSFVIMMLIAMFFARFQDNQTMIRIFNGIRPAVVALIVFPCISAVRALKLKYWQLVLPAIATFYMAMRTVTCLHRLGRNCRRAHLHIMVKR